MAATNEKDHTIRVMVDVKSDLALGVASLEEKHFLTETCKEMLLQPRNSMEAYCRNLKLNIDDTETMKYFISENWNCSRRPFGGLLSTFKNKRCKCGKLMNREMIAPKKGTCRIHEKGFVMESTFIISDDLKVMPENFEVSDVLLGIEDYYDLKEVMVNVTPKMMIDLLKFSLVSKTPLTDLMLMRKGKIFFPQKRALDFNFGEPQDTAAGKKVQVKVVLRKSDAKGLSILKASLISSSALTNGLGRFIKPIEAVENIRN
ncbi:hypothetical protein RIF29_30384 [Crotalaria pallida]|uniref:Uncharacterized protein n=1 Tax=Crotalaria pallida TaxID=3830 RepID=A0AAN9EG50_CROPI